MVDEGAVFLFGLVSFVPSLVCVEEPPDRNRGC